MTEAWIIAELCFNARECGRDCANGFGLHHDASDTDILIASAERTDMRIDLGTLDASEYRMVVRSFTHEV